ncbi:O-antigen ligase family protein [Candidatus Nitrospira bockiana]
MRLASHAGVLPLRRERSRTGLSWGHVFLMLYATVAVGRIQELIPVLAPLRPGLLAGGLALLAWLKAPGGLADKVPLEMPAVKDVMLLLVLAIVTVPIAVWPGNSLRYLLAVYMKTILLFLFVIYWCRTIREVRALIWVCCLATAALAVPGIFHGPDEGRYAAESLSYDANDLALLFVVAMPLILYLFSTSERRAKLVLLGLALLCLYGVVLTQSRGGLLALMVVGGLALSRSRMKRSAKYAIVACAVLVFGVLAGTAWKERIRTMWDPQTEYDRTAGGRTDIWKTGLVLLITRPWGAGIDGFVTAEGLSHGGFGKWNAAHNSFLQLAVELGVLGLAVFIRLLARTIRTLRTVETATDRRRASPLARPRGDPVPAPAPDAGPEGERDRLFLLAEALEISLWGFIVGGFFLSQAYSSLLYIMLALAVVCVRLVKQQTGQGALEGMRQTGLHVPRGPFSEKFRAG